MRILLLHPEDNPLDSRWNVSRWDLILDLGWAGRSQSQEWQKHFGCPVRGLFDFADWYQDILRIQQVFEFGNGRLGDAEGIDWWALLTPHSYLQFHEFLLLQKFAREVPTSPELFVTQPHPLAEKAARLLGTKLTTLSVPRSTPFGNRLSRYGHALRTLTPRQVRMIAGDKWDLDYRVRRFLVRKRKSDSRPKVLLPSAYRNVSRTVTSYASLLSEARFLLVATRADGFLPILPRNVEAVALASYASIPRRQATEQEIAALIAEWGKLEKKLRDAGDPALAQVVSMFRDLPGALRAGLRIRDAWREVLDREAVSAVLCGDENNAYTRLPVLLADKRGIRTVHCSHGALDASIFLRGACSDVYLAKGEMELDYLALQGVPPERLFLGGPPLTCPAHKLSGGDIFFFSEPYELYSGRTDVLYGEVLPNLCVVARKHGRKVVLKLHPFESIKARTRLVNRILSEDDRNLIEISAAPMSEQLLGRIWFALTVESSVAVECALAGVPCFLCGWFDLDLYAYAKQYKKFGAAQMLDHPGDIVHIPELIAAHPMGTGTAQRLYHPATPEQLAEVLQVRGRVGPESRVRAQPV